MFFSNNAPIQNLRIESPKFTELGLQMRNINTKTFNLAIFQKLIFGIFTAIFVKNRGEKRDKIGHIGQNTQLQKNGQIQNFSYPLP